MQTFTLTNLRASVIRTRIRAPFSITQACDIHWPKQCESIVTLVSQHSSLQHCVVQTIIVHCGTINQGSCYSSISSKFKYRADGCETLKQEVIHCMMPWKYSIDSFYLQLKTPASSIALTTRGKHIFVCFNIIPFSIKEMHGGGVGLELSVHDYLQNYIIIFPCKLASVTHALIDGHKHKPWSFTKACGIDR